MDRFGINLYKHYQIVTHKEIKMLKISERGKKKSEIEDMPQNGE